MQEQKQPLHVNDMNFVEEVIKSEKPVLVDFWAIWCNPCKAVGPLMDEIAEAFGNRIRIAHLNVDENPHITATYSIKKIPTVILFHHGKPTDTLEGIMPRERLEELINKVV